MTTTLNTHIKKRLLGSKCKPKMIQIFTFRITASIKILHNKHTIKRNQKNINSDDKITQELPVWLLRESRDTSTWKFHPICYRSPSFVKGKGVVICSKRNAWRIQCSRTPATILFSHKNKHQEENFTSKFSRIKTKKNIEIKEK